jgi:2-polyprenyl-6-hydroxyphenyl methylase/3-demethylubiquinone-9 3-methyltransferase
MAVGPAIRRSLGRLEQPASAAYRAMFFNVDDFVEWALMFAPDASRILEIGCGDGDVATALCAAYPRATYLGVDISSDAGRRFRGDRQRAAFLPISTSRLRADEPHPFDLVVIADVLHHVPDDADRAILLEDAVALLAPAGTVLVKEWERVPTPAYFAGWAADYYLSGDRSVRYSSRDELLRLVPSGLRHDHTVTVRPWRCNVVHVFRDRGN